MSLAHAFVSAKADGTDATKLRPSDWNAAHAFAGGALGSLLYRDTGASDGASWLTGAAGLPYWSGVGVAPTVLTLGSGLSVVGGALTAAGGGISGATIGDLLYASAPTTIGLLSDVAVGSVLVSGGVGVAPAWSATPTLTSLTLTGVVKAANGSAGAPSITFASDPTTGWFRNATDSWTYTLGSTSWFTLDGDVRLNALSVLGWTGGSSSSLVADVKLVREAADTLAQRNSTNAQRLNLGQGNTALAAGRLGMGRDAAAAFAPGAGYGLLRWETGTNAGTLKLVAYSGTSTTGVTVIDNVGGGN